MTLGSIAFATLLSLTTSAALVAEQVGTPTQLGGMCPAYSMDQSPPPCDDTENRTQSIPGQPARPRPGPRRRPFLTVLGAIPLVTCVGATGLSGSEVLTPADRFAMSQVIGAGYVVNPQFRFGVIAIFNEVVTGLPPTADAWQFGGIAPIAIGTFDHFIIGGGPVVGYRSGGIQQSDVGVVVLSGVSIPLKRGLALNVVAPTMALFARRVTVSVGVAVGVAKVF